MAKLVFPDGNVREYDNKTALEIAESISISLKKKLFLRNQMKTISS